jgi:hypothetical protein
MIRSVPLDLACARGDGHPLEALLEFWQKTLALEIVCHCHLIGTPPRSPVALCVLISSWFLVLLAGRLTHSHALFTLLGLVSLLTFNPVQVSVSARHRSRDYGFSGWLFVE